MCRVLLIFSLLLGVLASLHAADPSEQFLSAYESFQQAENLERSGDTSEAISKYRFSESLLTSISKSDPSWQKPVIDYRLKKVHEALSRLQGNAPDGEVTSETTGISNNESTPAPADVPTATAVPVQQDTTVSPSIEIVPPSAQSGPSSSSRPSGASAAETRRLRQTIEDLRKQLQEANEAQDAEKQRARDLENADWVQKRSELLSQLDVAKRRISDLEHDLHSRDSWGQDLKDLQKKLDDTVADKLVEEEQFENSYKKVADQNATLVKDLQDAKGQIVATADSKQKIEQLNQEVASGKEALQQLQARLDHSEQAARESLAGNDALRKQLSDVSDELAVVQKQAQQVAPLRKKIKELQAGVDEGVAAVRRNTSLEADLQALQEDRDRLARKVSQLGEAAQEASKVSGLTAESEALKQTVTELQGHLNADEKNLAKAHAEAAATSKAESKARELQAGNLADAEADRAVLEEEQQRLVAKLTQASLWLQALQKQGESLVPLRSEVGKLQGELADNARNMEETTAKLTEAQKAVEAMRVEAAQKDQVSHNVTDLLTQQNSALQEQLKTALGKAASAVDHASDSAALQDQVKKLQEEMDLNARNYAASQQQLAELSKSQPGQQKALLEKEKALDEARDGAAKLQSQLDQAGQQITALKKQGDQEEARMKELQDELADRDARIARLKKRKGNAEDEQMAQENELLRGIVLREVKDEAKRAQAHRVMEDELARLHVQSDTLHDQMALLAAPAVELTAQERALFKDAELVVSDQGGANLTASISAPLSGAASTNASATTTVTNAGQTPPGANDQVEANNPDVPPVSDRQAPSGTNTAANSAVLPWQGKFKELLAQAKEEFDRQDYLEAENSFQESLKLSPNDYFALSNLGVVEFQLGKMKEAEESLKKASEQSTNNSFALTTLGIVHYRQKRLADAEKVLRKSIAVNNQDFTAHNYLGIVLAASGNGKAGESEIMKAIEINPNYADAHFNLAVIYATGKPPAKMMARQHYNKALELGSPPDPSLEHLLE